MSKSWWEILEKFNNGYEMPIKSYEYFWETSPIYPTTYQTLADTKFIQRFVETTNLSNKQDYSQFKEHIIRNPNEQYAIAFENLSVLFNFLMELAKK